MSDFLHDQSFASCKVEGELRDGIMKTVIILALPPYHIIWNFRILVCMHCF